MPQPFAFLDQPDLRHILSLLNQHHETRIVGGAVRNALLGLPLNDIDLATTALPQQVMECAAADGLRALPTGIAHGTVTILLGSSAFEITTLREDVATDGRHAEVRFGSDFRTDALRRDFTINALSLSLDGTLHDYTNGAADLAAGLVRFIGDPAQRIREDYLRALRFFRFSAAYAKQDFDAEALAAIVETRAGLRLLSHERIASEVFKILLGPRAHHAATLMSHYDLWPILLGGIVTPACLARLIAIEAAQVEAAAAQPGPDRPAPDPVLRLAALAASTPQDVPRLREALRLSNADRQALHQGLELALIFHGAQSPPPRAGLPELMFLHGKQATLFALKLAFARADAAITDASWHAALRFVRDTPQPSLPFSGADLLARGLGPGKPMGQALKNLQALWIRAGFPKDPQALAALLDEAVKPNPTPAPR